MSEIMFPHSSMRKNQDTLILDIKQALEKKENILIDAPTGLGKTAAALAPALTHALENNLTVFFLTSRHTQHKIAVDTLKAIREKYNRAFGVADIIGRKWMCLQPGVETFAANDFNEFCKNLREDYTCDFYVKARKNTGIPTVASENLVADLAEPLHTDELIERCSDHGLCPYEIDLMLAGKAHVIIADYYHIFNPVVRDNFFRKIEKKLSESIIIVDEAHNVPDRIRSLLTQQISSVTIKQAIKEAKEFNKELILYLSQLQDVLNSFGARIKEGREILVKKEEFISAVERIRKYEDLMDDLDRTAELVRTAKRQSFVGALSQFLESWKGADTGFARILEIKHGKQPNVILSYRCLDPSLVSKDVGDLAYSVVLMSGTLRPTKMFRDILGLDATCKEFGSPFPKQNRLNIVVPTVTTKYSHRGKQQYAKIASVCADIVNAVPGNSALYFPSYSFRDEVLTFFDENCEKKILMERPGLTTQQKTDLLDTFKKNKEDGAVLLGVVGGSFSEGIDLPGDLLKCVVVVGLPLGPPDLETQELVKYYDFKFNRGWDYGYVLPAITKTIQTAGRCIRSETDKGVIAFLDYRYALPSYKKCFPADWDLEITEDYEDLIKEFFI